MLKDILKGIDELKKQNEEKIKNIDKQNQLLNQIKNGSYKRGAIGGTIAFAVWNLFKWLLNLII